MLDIWLQFVFLLGSNAAHQNAGEDEELFQMKAVFHLRVGHGDYLQHVLLRILKIMCSHVTRNAKT